MKDLRNIDRYGLRENVADYMDPDPEAKRKAKKKKKKKPEKTKE